MIMFVGQVERGMLGREAFQELDYKAVFGSIAKWVVEIDSAERIPELVARAFRVAMQGRPGPVVVSLPEDILTEMADVVDAPRVEPADTVPAEADMKALGEIGEGGEEAVHDRRRLALECGRRQIGRRLCRARRYSGRGLVPAGAAVSRRSSELCRRSRHRSQSEACRAHQGGRRSAAGRRPHVGSPVVGLHADRRADAEAEAGARASGRRRARARLSADAGHSGEPDRVCVKACGARYGWARQCGGGGDRACGLSRLVRQSAQTSRTLPVSAR